HGVDQPADIHSIPTRRSSDLPLASANAVLSREEKEAGVALIDIGGGTTDLAVFKDGIIRHTAVIPFGGNVITEDIKEGCSIIERSEEHTSELQSRENLVCRLL